MDKVACKRCGALVLPETAARTGGECMPCKKGMRRPEPEQDLRAPTWDALRNDLVVAELDGDGAEEAVIPKAVLVGILRTITGGREAGSHVLPDRVSVRELETMLEAAGRTLVVDHRSEWSETFAQLRKNLDAIGGSARMTGDAPASMRADRPRGVDPSAPLRPLVVEVDGRAATIERPESRDIAEVVAQLNELLSPLAGYRPFTWSTGSDTNGWALLHSAAWSELDARHPRLVSAMFATNMAARR